MLVLAGCGSTAGTHPSSTAATQVPASATPASTQHVFFGVTSTTDETSKIYALNVGDGSIMWTSATISAPASAVAEADGMVYLFSEGHTSGGVIVALRASDGMELWQVAVDKSVGVFGGQGFALDNGVVYVGGTLGSGDYANAVSAYRASDGTLLWSKTGLGTLRIQISAANGVVYAAAMDSVTALRGSDGTVLWQRQSLSPYIDNIPVIAAGTVYVAATGDVFALSATDGSVRWHYRVPVDATCTCVHMVSVGGGQVYTTGRHHVVALSAANGTVVYTLPSSSLAEYVSYAVGTVYSTWDSGKLIATRASDGTPLWSAQLLPGYGGVGAALSTALFVGSNDQSTPPVQSPNPGRIYALRPSDGSPLWQFQPAAGYVSFPVVG
jgi:outer membrane protein assembly factor BamB